MASQETLKKHLDSECLFRAIYGSKTPQLVKTKNIVQNVNFSHPGRFSCEGDTLQAIQKAYTEAKSDEGIYPDFSGVRFTWTLKKQSRKDYSMDIVGKMVSSDEDKQFFAYKDNMRCPVNKCPSFLKDVKSLREHWMESHVPFSIHYACPVSEKCKEKFKGLKGLEAHMKYSHKSSPMSLTAAAKKSEAFYLANDLFIEPDVLPPLDLPPSQEDALESDTDIEGGESENATEVEDNAEDDDYNDIGGIEEDYDDSDEDTTWTPGGKTPSEYT